MIDDCVLFIYRLNYLGKFYSDQTNHLDIKQIEKKIGNEEYQLKIKLLF